MSDQAEHGRGPVPVQYHQFQISDEEGPVGPALPRRHNGLIEVQDGIATVYTGIHTGDVDVTVTLHPRAPEAGDTGWDEIVDVSLRSVSGNLMDDLDEDLPVLSFDGPGDYRLRVHARGRDIATDFAPDQNTEWYLLQVWPAPAQDAVVRRQTDRYGTTVRVS
ncbi:hypothetical protein [Streptomyces sp. PanSC9]|uniref:hypothetical protein n=1 Tax=Streptomyces sp. PanSC9 TaxID=1520461 RepID=UPI000FACB99B|nr:hypothetical protein [Streptomyces sp. PanSC9]ROP44254.1 hypothetical protein EDD94_8046 [Streptomyces sp. PanSC9]